jgi:epoxide hydrolase
MTDAEAKSGTLRPFRVDVPQADLDDLAERLARTRFSREPPGTGGHHDGGQSGDYGVPLQRVKDLAEYWRTGYDWRTWEAKLNAHPQFTTTIDGQTIHFLHVRSPERDAFPLILTHGWPMSVVEYLDLIGTLADPQAHGGDPATAFDLVIPSVPGFAFSTPVSERGWNRYRIARAWAELMRRLGYHRYGAHGNDIGSLISPEVGRADPEHVAGVHVTQTFSQPSGDPAELAGLGDDDLAKAHSLRWFVDNRGAYLRLQATQPLTLGHALADSPAGQLAWSLQLFDDTLSADYILTNVTLHWLTTSAASAAFVGYYENAHAERPTEPTTVPLGVASFANDVLPSVRAFAERDHANIVSWNAYDRGGHHATQDAPDLLVHDLREFFRSRRS